MLDALKLGYVSYAALGAAIASGEPILGIAAFGAAPPPELATLRSPALWIDMPVLRGPGCCEVWRSDEPVEYLDVNGLRLARSASVLFGSLQVPEDGGLEAASRLAYARVFETIDSLGFPYLMRAWNYFAGINADDDSGIERYRRFNVGRHDAFEAHGRVIGVDMPAACALGSRRGPLSIHFIAAKEKGRPIENPRQVSAYRYPQRYGPRSPTFSRAMLMQPGGRRLVAISGTSSITGHETRHAGDAAAQVEETLANIRVLLEAAGCAAEPSPDAGADLLLKAYLRDPHDLAVVERAIQSSFGAAEVMYLHADICRSDLLVEIEGLYTAPPA